MKSFSNLSFLLLLLFALFSCNNNPDNPGPGASFAEVINAGGAFETFEAKSDSTVLDSSESEVNGERWVCVTKEYDLVSGGESYFNFNPSSEIIWPGNLLQGNSLTESTPNPIVLDRGPGCVTIDLVNGSGNTQKCMDRVSNGNIIESLNEIIDNNNGILPAQFTYTAQEVQSQQEMAFKMGVNVNTLTTDIKGKLSINLNSEYKSFLVTLTQNYYTMIFEKPTSYEAFFDPDVKPEDLAAYIGPDNPASYVSSVTYGRRFYLLIESTSSRTEINASIDATYEAAVTNGQLDASAKYVKDLDNSTIKVFALGGDQGLALRTFNGDINAVGEFLTDGGNYRTGVPLSYVVRSLRTHQDLAIKVATKYETTICEPIVFDDNPPPFTAFWSNTFDAIGAATQLHGTSDILLFNHEGTQYVRCDQTNYTFTGPYTLDDPAAPLGDCPLSSVSAAQKLPSGNVYLHDGTGTKYVAFNIHGDYGTVTPLQSWGLGDHPFDLFGISAAVEDYGRVIHFKRDGTEYTIYKPISAFSNPTPLFQWGPVDNACPIDAVGAAVRIDLAQEYYVLFDMAGTTYTIYRSGSNDDKFIGYYQL